MNTNLTSSANAGTRISLTDKANEFLDRRKVSQETRDAFVGLLEKSEEVTPQNAKNFLNSLSFKDREVIRIIHCLADPIQVDSLTEEGAYNLIRQPGDAADLNNDGFLRIGAAMTRSFPPPNAPESVKKAWEEVTAGKPLKETMLLQTMFWPIEAAANVKYDSQGKAVGIYTPFDKEYVNIYSQPGFTYSGLINKYVEYLNNVRSYIGSQEYQKNMDFITQFKNALAKYAVN